MGASTNGLSRNPLKVKIPVRIWMFSPGIDNFDKKLYNTSRYRNVSHKRDVADAAGYFKFLAKRILRLTLNQKNVGSTPTEFKDTPHKYSHLN